MTTIENIKYFVLHVLSKYERRQIILAQTLGAAAAFLEAIVILIFYKFITYYVSSEESLSSDILLKFISSLKFETSIISLFIITLF